jgi:hypothetical protein
MTPPPVWPLHARRSPRSPSRSSSCTTSARARTARPRAGSSCTWACRTASSSALRCALWAGRVAGPRERAHRIALQVTAFSQAHHCVLNPRVPCDTGGPHLRPAHGQPHALPGHPGAEALQHHGEPSSFYMAGQWPAPPARGCAAARRGALPGECLRLSREALPARAPARCAACAAWWRCPRGPGWATASRAASTSRRCPTRLWTLPRVRPAARAPAVAQQQHQQRQAVRDSAPACQPEAAASEASARAHRRAAHAGPAPLPPARLCERPVPRGLRGGGQEQPAHPHRGERGRHVQHAGAAARSPCRPAAGLAARPSGLQLLLGHLPTRRRVVRSRRQACRLRYTPRRLLIHPDSRLLLVAEADHAAIPLAEREDLQVGPGGGGGRAVSAEMQRGRGKHRWWGHPHPQPQWPGCFWCLNGRAAGAGEGARPGA